MGWKRPISSSKSKNKELKSFKKGTNFEKGSKNARISSAAVPAL